MHDTVQEEFMCGQIVNLIFFINVCWSGMHRFIINIQLNLKIKKGLGCLNVTDVVGIFDMLKV